MGAATFAITPGMRTRHHPVDGNQRVVEGLLTLSASYATGGDTLDEKVELGLDHVENLVVLGDTAGYELRLGGTATAPKVEAQEVGAETTATTDLADAIGAVRVEFWGK